MCWIIKKTRKTQQCSTNFQLFASLYQVCKKSLQSRYKYNSGYYPKGIKRFLFIKKVNKKHTKEIKSEKG